MKKSLAIVALMLICVVAHAAPKQTVVSSPDGRTTMLIDWSDATLRWSLQRDGKMLVHPSKISMTTSNGVWGEDVRSAKVRRVSVNREVEAPLYRQAKVREHYNQATIDFRASGVRFAVEVRVFDDGAAYRFVSQNSGGYDVLDECAEFSFDAQSHAWVPYVNYKSNATREYSTQYYTSFENTYHHTTLEGINPHRLIFAPVVVEHATGVKMCITEADLESYPGMFLSNPDGDSTLDTEFAPVPDVVEQGDHNMLQGVVKSRKDYIARCEGARTFPWRVVALADEDKDLADNDIVWRLGDECRIADTSWIKPGKVAWEWWNHWGLTGVDFEAGVNTATYKAYIDFAAEYGVEYVILDEGWAVKYKNNLLDVVPEIDLKHIVDYAAQKGVGIILWAGYNAFNADIEGVCRHYAAMGVKGFKIDFMDRDDQPMMEFYYHTAEACAEHKLLVDFHGCAKPAGMNRTYPNVINFEAVFGLEQMKWSKTTVDHMAYDVTMPFIRMVAGPIDYTQGAMRNATKKNYHPVNREPMSQGTRCHQLAAYAVFYSPLSMLCDSPSAYRKESECAEFIASVPTVWDETVVLDGKIGEYVVTARRKGNTWYIGGMTNWTARTLDVDLSPILAEGNYTADMFRDGANAHRIASDYKREKITLPASRKLTVHLAPGGGFMMQVAK